MANFNCKQKLCSWRFPFNRSIFTSGYFSFFIQQFLKNSQQLIYSYWILCKLMRVMIANQHLLLESSAFYIFLNFLVLLWLASWFKFGLTMNSKIWKLTLSCDFRYYNSFRSREWKFSKYCFSSSKCTLKFALIIIKKMHIFVLKAK